ncbi:MAG: hypothetical protein V4627_11100 [Pseudomonadota bacterium]
MEHPDGACFAADIPAVTVFSRAPDLIPLWTILDSTPEGRPADW